MSMPAFALTALRHWKLVAVALLVAALAIQTLRIDSLKGKLELCQEKQRQIVEKGEQQKGVTKGTVKRAQDGMKQVEKPAQRVEQAPLHPRELCQTPREILEADL